MARIKYVEPNDTVDFIHPITRKVRPGQVTAVNGDGTINIRSADGANFAGVSNDPTLPLRLWGTKRPNLLSLADAEFDTAIGVGSYGAASGNSALSLDSSVPLAGTKSLRCSISGTPAINDGFAMGGLLYAIQPNTLYVVSVLCMQDVATADATLQLQLIFRDSGGTAVGSPSTTPLDCLVPTTLSVSGVSQPTAAFVAPKVLYKAAPNVGDTFMVDKFCVREGSDPTYVKPVVIS